MHQIAKRLLICMLIWFCAFTLKAQTVVSIPFFFEKVFVHTDRDMYTQGEDIWFKAYLVDAQTNKPINYSHNLYVELINPGLKIISRHVIRMDDGLGNGDFKLDDTLSAGTYRVRAYTNWMRNFGDSFIFEKNISITNTVGKKTTAGVVQKSVKRLRQKPVAGKQDTLPPGPMVSFFPEGGSLVDDVSSVVGVKAEDAFGRGVAASGQVFASSNRMVAKFTCDSLGFGSFTITPDETQLYHADVVINGQPYTFRVKHGQTRGFTLSANTMSPFITAIISCNGVSLREWGGSNLVIEARHGGKIIYKERLKVRSKDMIVQIPDANFPEGIAFITIYDEHSLPLGERLVYVRHPNNTKLSIKTDSAVYHSRQKVSVKIKLSDTTKTHLSLAAVDAGLIPVQAENIVSYLELRSEIKGTIAHPERYFDSSNVNRDKQLDLLLLTQGWRDFVWKDIAQQALNTRFEPEQGMTITGYVRQLMKNQKIANANITLFMPKALDDKMFTAKTDSAGHFSIYGSVLYGNGYGLFTSRTDKGKHEGWIHVDSLWRNILRVKAPEYSIADSALIKSYTPALSERGNERQRFSFTAINNLKQVEIGSTKNAAPDKVFDVTKKDLGPDDDHFRFLLPYIVSHVKRSYIGIDTITGLPTIMYRHGLYPDMRFDQIVDIKCTYINDSTKIRPFDMSTVIMNDVSRLTVSYPYGEQQLFNLKLVLRPGALDKSREWSTVWADIKGYNEARTFFTPRHEVPDATPDYRTTIHWEPNITTDAHGEATVSFYNADPKGKIWLMVQGITDKGVPVAASAGYAVK